MKSQAIATFHAKFDSARFQLRNRNWKLAKKELEEALNFATRQGLKDEREMIERVQGELENYFQAKLSPRLTADEIHISAIKSRKSVLLRESRYFFPHAIFFLDFLNHRFVGRKTLSEHWLDFTIGELHCSQLRASMLLGVVESRELTKDEVHISYHPLTPGEKLSLFASLVQDKNLEITFPYSPLVMDTEEERHTAQEGWVIDPTRAEELGVGEEHLRDYTIQFLSQFEMEKKILYDPACSTGQFLKSLKDHFPKCRTIGQDLSESMVDYARRVLDEVHQGDAIRSLLPAECVDFTFLRFLNHEVVTSLQAPKLFVEILKRAKSGSYLFLMGHTPVILNAEFFKELGLSVLQSVAHSPDSDFLFQYYVVQKPKSV